MSPSARRRSRTLTALTASTILVLTQLTPISATHAYDTERHWEQNPGGGLNRWVPYKDRTNHTVFGSWYQHNMIHYYESNYWRPYQVSSDQPADIIGKTYWDSGEWWGFTGAPDTNDPAAHRHVYRAVSEFMTGQWQRHLLRRFTLSCATRSAMLAG